MTDGSSSYPAGWKPRIKNLSKRFPNLSRDIIIQELQKAMAMNK